MNQPTSSSNQLTCVFYHMHQGGKKIPLTEGAKSSMSDADLQALATTLMSEGVGDEPNKKCKKRQTGE